MSTPVSLASYFPAIQGHAPLPKGRQFYGAISSLHQERGLGFGEVIHATERAIPCHVHETAYYCLVLAGGYEESGGRERFYFQPFNSAFNRSGTKHDGRIASSGVRIFTAEIGQGWVEEFLELGPGPDTTQDSHGGELTSLGVQLYRECCTKPAACALTVEALIWELLATAAGMQNREKGAKPSWWGRVKDLLHADFRRDLRISELATEAGVHPVHLARVFRRVSGKTPGEYLQRLRVKFASEKLTLTDCRIAEISADAGFADQSHMTRVFRRYTRTTPRELRRAFALPHG
jgi:AraC family transcriptional regulator